MPHTCCVQGCDGTAAGWLNGSPYCWAHLLKNGPPLVEAPTPEPLEK